MNALDRLTQRFGTPEEIELYQRRKQQSAESGMTAPNIIPSNEVTLFIAHANGIEVGEHKVLIPPQPHIIR